MTTALYAASRQPAVLCLGVGSRSGEETVMKEVVRNPTTELDGQKKVFDNFINLFLVDKVKTVKKTTTFNSPLFY